MQAIAAELDRATCVYFDDYAAVSEHPDDMEAWLAAGADPNAWRTRQLAHDLHALRAGAAVMPPGATMLLQPTPFLVLEEPFGRERQEMAADIDFVVVIDIPLELALARRLLRDIQRLQAQGSAAQALLRLDSYLQNYVALGSRLYGTVNRRAMASCDLVVDGTQPTEQLARHIVAAVRTRFEPGG